MTARALVALALTLAPRSAAACAACLDSAFGDRSFNWAFVFFMLAPFAVAAGLAGALAWLSFGTTGRIEADRREPDSPTEEGRRC